MQLFGAYFWGIFLVVIGILLIIKHMFNFKFAVSKIAFGLFIVYIGLFFLLNNVTDFKTRENVIFGDFNFYSERVINKDNEYNIIFSSSVVDLREIEIDKDTQIEVNTIFSDGTVLINSDMRIRVEATSAFGRVELPNEQSVTFGDATYFNKEGEGPLLIIKADCVFGNLEIETDSIDGSGTGL